MTSIPICTDHDTQQIFEVPKQHMAVMCSAICMLSTLRVEHAFKFQAIAKELIIFTKCAVLGARIMNTLWKRHGISTTTRPQKGAHITTAKSASNTRLRGATIGSALRNLAALAHSQARGVSSVMFDPTDMFRCAVAVDLLGSSHVSHTAFWL